MQRSRSRRHRYEQPVDGLGTNKLAALENDFLILQRRREHRCWALFFLSVAAAVGLTRLLPGLQFVSAPVRALFPDASPADIVWRHHGILALAGAFAVLSIYFACRSVSGMRSSHRTCCSVSDAAVRWV